jgi:superfamily II DNA/RNA helicase
LIERGFKAATLHGDMGQAAREKALNDFKGGKSDVLIATDVAARGIDIDGITHVINYQCPEDEKTYVHRIGRTARAGAYGIALTFVDWDELARWKMIDMALKLGLAEPVETYSSSEHLYAMMKIPAGSPLLLRKKLKAQRLHLVRNVNEYALKSLLLKPDQALPEHCRPIP